MQYKIVQKWTMDARREALRQKIEEHRKKLESHIVGREDLLGDEQQQLSRELDCLIVQYANLE